MEGVPHRRAVDGGGGEDCAPRTVLALTASDTLSWLLWGKLQRLSELLLLPDEMKMKTHLPVSVSSVKAVCVPPAAPGG